MTQPEKQHTTTKQCLAAGRGGKRCLLPWQIPVTQLLPIDQQCPSQVRGRGIKRTNIKMFPNRPCSKYDDRVYPFLSWISTLCFSLCPQSSKIHSSGCRDKACRPTICSRLDQKVLAKREEVSIWFNVSSCWSQSGQCSGCGRPHCASLLAIQHILCAGATNHMKKQHLCGAQDFQILFCGPKNSDQIMIGELQSTQVQIFHKIYSFSWLLNSNLYYYISIPIKRMIP
jgi:hypothetical protein